MRSSFPNRSLVIRSLVVAFAFSVLASIAVAHYVGQQQHPAGTETTWIYDPDGNLVQVDTTYDDKGRVTEKKEYDKNKKLRKRTIYKYLKDFKEPDTSTTTYQPDGKTPQTTTNVDHDKDGNPTITVTTNYDEKGTETGGTKRERDPKTGKDRCYKWDPKKQEYEEVPCPQETAQASSDPPAKPSPYVRVKITDRNTSDDTCPCPGPCPCPDPSPTPKAVNNQNARVETGGGLQTVTFDTPPGQIRVYLPDDIRAGDTISGTVVAEPKGQTTEERARNMVELNGYVIELETPKNPNGTSNPKVTITAQVTPTHPSLGQFTLALPLTFIPGPPTPTLTNVTSANSSGLGITLTNTTGSSTVGGTTTVPIEMVSLSLQSVAPLKLPQLPTIGQQGRPIVITGPFDGNSSNTTFNWCINLTPACEQNPSTGGVIAPLAESPRKLVFRAPVNVTGPIEIQLKEGNTETKGTFRNVGVNLTAPKTSLLKGESTTLKIEVSGLQGITQPVPLHLTKGGVVTMQGGDTQTMPIKPSEVQSNGTYTTTRTITGVQTGAWNATATVVVFDFCLQDDNNGNLLTFSSTTGDYIFCQGRSTVAGANPISLSTLNFLGTDFSGGVKVSAADVNDSGGNPTSPANIGPGASITRNGAITVADFNYKLGYIHVQIDDYNHTGNASGYIYQQITVPSNASPKKTNFTITDRDTRNNTCSCK